MILSQALKRIREEIGDEIRLSGTATGGGIDRIDDTALLTQADNYWKWLTVRITDTTDGLAPKGEARRISSSTLGSITVEVPFSVGINSGDKYEIAFFGRDRLVSIINETLKEWANLIPYKAIEQVTTTIDSDRTALNNPGEILWIEKIQYRDTAKQETYNYEGYWQWDDHAKQIQWDFFWKEAKTLDVHIARTYPAVSNDTDDLNIKSQHEHLFLRLCVANVIASISTQEWRDNRGELRPLEIRMGDLVHRYGNFRSAAREHRQIVLEEIKSELGKTITGKLSNRGLRKNLFNRNEDPDGWAPPPIFWELK